MKKGNAIALLPIGVFLAIYLGLGLTFEYVLKIEGSPRLMNATSLPLFRYWAIISDALVQTFSSSSLFSIIGNIGSTIISLL